VCVPSSWPVDLPGDRLPMSPSVPACPLLRPDRGEGSLGPLVRSLMQHLRRPRISPGFDPRGRFRHLHPGLGVAPALLRVNPDISPGCCHCRCSRASGCCAALEDPAARALSSGNGAPSSTRSRPTRCGTVTGNLAATREDRAQRPGLYRRHQLGRDRKWRLWLLNWCAAGTPVTSSDCCSIHRPGRQRVESGFGQIRGRP